ncbi:MFS transporter, SP family,ral alpha glucoside:H+ symporter [Geosmithia morbida]|uniref:MFS transporter, SP family,ral alpha glucoside:H+ symporter n=1 Tax=Geosmithia morbida TaxID=1094350 RepID=A0A9P4Z1D2_9HYPO|nr:MFS transporter, SP family,ral alpha glucoside:H+ symporter [Geosmithia morbida]KAF4125488.1 MFS transporter, SP family,ral alpha glucoside:H+ symporter [Geosmithia morbida]
MDTASSAENSREGLNPSVSSCYPASHTKDDLREGAIRATHDQHSTTFVEAIRRYPKAAAWSAVVTLSIIMDGYDTALMGNMFGFPAFQRVYGYMIGSTGSYTLSLQWQIVLGMATPMGNMVGIYLNALLGEHLGHKPVFLGSLVLLSGLISILFFATSLPVLFAGQILCGVPWGVFTTLAPGYASEVVPLALRSYLETWVMCCWGIGQLISYAVLLVLNGWDSQWAYRVPFAIQWVWPVIIIPAAVFCPESPWWYVRKGMHDDAERSVRRLTSGPTSERVAEEAKNAVALMVETDRLEQEMSKDTSYLACFRGSDLRRTEVACVSWGAQVLTNFIILRYSSYFFQLAGLTADASFKVTVGMGGIHIVFNLLSAPLTGNYGRRTLFLWGCAALTLPTTTLGLLALAPQSAKLGSATSAVYLAWFAVWCLTLGPLPYVINGEVSSTRLRSKTLALARATNLVMQIINSVVAPYILNPQSGDWRGKAGFLTAALTVLSFTWGYFRLPETGRRTFEELDILFSERDLPARKFAKAVIHRHSQTNTVMAPGYSSSTA